MVESMAVGSDERSQDRSEDLASFPGGLFAGRDDYGESELIIYFNAAIHPPISNWGCHTV